MRSKLKILARLLVLCLLAGIAYYLHKTEMLQKTVSWIEGYGFWAPWLFVGIFTLTSIFFIPSFFFSFAAGILFGIFHGIVLSLLGIGIGSTGAFLIGRYLAPGLFERIFSSNENFHKVSEAVKFKGWKIVLLARLTPIFPFLIANYGFGLTRMPARHYFMASVLGSIPSTSVYVYLGSVAGSFANLNVTGRSRTPLEWGLISVGLLAAVALTFYLRRVASHALDETLQ